MEQNHCGHLGFSIDIILACFDPEVILLQKQVLAQSDLRFEKRSNQDGGCDGHLGFSIGSFCYFVSHKGPNAHHQVSIQLDYRGDVQNMNSQHFSHINV